VDEMKADDIPAIQSALRATSEESAAAAQKVDEALGAAARADEKAEQASATARAALRTVTEIAADRERFDAELTALTDASERVMPRVMAELSAIDAKADRAAATADEALRANRASEERFTATLHNLSARTIADVFAIMQNYEANHNQLMGMLQRSFDNVGSDFETHNAARKELMDYLKADFAAVTRDMQKHEMDMATTSICIASLKAKVNEIAAATNQPPIDLTGHVQMM